MNKQITKEDLLLARNDGVRVWALAQELGVSRRAVKAACEKFGIELPAGRDLRTPHERLTAMVDDMTPIAAVQFLLDIIADMRGADDQSFVWPDLSFPPVERAYLQFLYRNEGRVCTYDQLMDALYSHEADQPEIKIIAVYLCKIRKKIEGRGFALETVWGQGVRFVREPGTVFPWERQQ